METTQVERAASTEWQKGWAAAAAGMDDALAAAFNRGRLAGAAAGPTWANLVVVAAFALIIGFLVAMAVWL